MGPSVLSARIRLQIRHVSTECSSGSVQVTRLCLVFACETNDSGVGCINMDTKICYISELQIIHRKTVVGLVIDVTN